MVEVSKSASAGADYGQVAVPATVKTHRTTAAPRIDDSLARSVSSWTITA